MSQSNNTYGFERPFEPDSLAQRALPYLKEKLNLVDVGCGEGADSVFFAQQGLDVTALDNNKETLSGLKSYADDHGFSNITIENCNIIEYNYPKDHFDAVSCLLVGCCMRRSEFEKMLQAVKATLKPNGIMIMSLRNYLDQRFVEYASSLDPIEPNTYYKPEDCCEIRYFIEKGRLKELFHGFEVLYYFEGMAPDKYQEVEEHGDSCIICQKKMDS